MSEPKKGYEARQVDISGMETVEQGFEEAEARFQRLSKFGVEALGTKAGGMLLWGHLALMSFLARASALNKGIVSAVRENNPHATFTLLRAYLELAVLIRWVDKHPEYAGELEKPRPEGKRERFRTLFEDAADEFSGVLSVYDELNEMAHFGATAFWHPFDAKGDEGRTLAFSTAPHWKRPDTDPKIALAMLEEAEEASLAMLERFRANHLDPEVERILTWQQVAADVAAAFGGTPGELGENHMFTLPNDVMREALERGLAVYCEEHQAIEKAKDATPEQFRAWIDERTGSAATPTDATAEQDVEVELGHELSGRYPASD